MKLIIFAISWIFKTINRNPYSNNVTERSLIRDAANPARGSPRLFQHPPTLACVVRSSLRIPSGNN